MSQERAEHTLPELLIKHRSELLGWVQREAGAVLLRFESAEDLVQGIHQEAFGNTNQFEWQGEAAFGGWLFLIGRRYLAARRDHWLALKRNGANILRLTWGDGRGTPPPNDGNWAGSPADTATGPATFAFRREQMLLASRAVDLLLPRDRDIVQWSAAGATMAELASRLNVSIETAQRAKSRSIERLQKAYQLVSRAAAQG